jgi:aspartate/methionine/tyrosine aminotransferase
MYLSSLVREMINEPSPIRQIMKMASRQNIINMGLDPDEVISFGGGWVGHHSPEMLREEYMEICQDRKKFHESGAYSPTLGFDECREAISKMEKELFDVKTEKENIIVGQSSTQLAHDLFISFLDKEDKILIFDPTYANYNGQIKLANKDAKIIRLKVLDEEEWKYKPDYELSEEFKDIYYKEKPKLIIFPSPDNPSSQVFSDGFVKTILDISHENKSYLIIDYAYKAQCFIKPPSYFSFGPSDYPELIALHSNSKWGRGLGRRLGWIIANEEVIEAMERVQQCTILCPDTMHQMAFTSYIEKSIQDKSLKKYIEKIKNDYKKAAEVTINCIKEYLNMPCLTPQGGLYTLMKVNEDGEEFVKRILKKTGVLFIPGKGFGDTLKQGVRISYGPLVENLNLIEEGLKRVANCIR